MAKKTNPISVDVAIVGAGPVGLTLANLLSQRGLDVVILEREAAGYALPRAVTFDDEIMRLFQGMGLEAEVGAVTELGSDAQFVDGDGKVLVRWERSEGITPNGWHVNNRFHQPTLEKVLRKGLKRFSSAELRWNAEVVGLKEEGARVLVTCRDGMAIDAGYVVGCDGGRSFTRKWIGSGNEDLGFHEEWLIIDLLLPKREENPDRKTTHYCGTARMGSKVYVGRDRKRWELRLNADDDPTTFDDPEVIWSMLSEWITPDEARIERTAVYTFHSLMAENWRSGRVFIAGDAAHQTPPFMGQGMCAGLRDAANLAWKLDMASKGGVPHGFLDTYQAERRPHVGAFIDLTMNMGRLINQTAKGITKDVANSVDDGSQSMKLIRPQLGPGLSVGNTERAGSLFAQVTLSDGQRLDDALGIKVGLLAAPEFEMSLEDQEMLSNTGVVILQNAALREALQGEMAVMVRPDRAILGSWRDQSNVRDFMPENWKVA